MANKKNTNGPRKEDTENEKTRKYKISNNTSKNKNSKGKSNNGKKKINKVKKHPILRRIIKIMVILAIMLVIVGAGVFAGIFFGLFGDDFTITKDVLVINKDNSVAVDAAGNIIAHLAGDENRKIISMDEMPKYLPKAFISIEDERFYKHQGVDLKRTAAATVTYIGNKLFGKGNSSFGGSTITQQLVKNLTNEKQDSPTRKVKEMSKAYQVERLISKDQILELYLNLIFLGDKTYGVEVASQYYFSKSAKDLTVAEAAYLAGINHVPNGYKPFEQYADKENAEELKTKMKEKINKRTKTVLNKMKELEAINEDEYTTAIAEVDNGLPFNQGSITTGLASYSYHTAEAINQAKKDLAKKNGWDEEFADLKLRSGGYTIYTTQDSSIQARMEEEYKKESYIKNTKKAKDPNTGEMVNVQSAMTIINHTNGQVVGMVGGLGNNVNAVGVNRAMRPRSTGSSIKPLASVAPSLEAKTMTAATVYDDSPTKFGNKSVKDDHDGYKGLITIREAIKYSQNVPQAKAITVLGPLKSIEFLRKIGFSYLVTAAENPSANDESYSLALGGLTNGATTLEMAAGYAMIANDGEYISPTFYTKVVDKEGKTVLEPTQERVRVMSVENAYVLKSILTAPTTSGGTAPYCAMSNMDVAAKTGTTNDSTDRWLCGFTPYYAGATYFGFDYPADVKYSGSPSNPAGGIWSSIMKDIHKGLEGKRFVRPDGVVNATVCKKTGLLPSASCETVSEVFVKGTVPTETCEGGQSAIICTESGMLVNDNCPDETREETYVHAKPPYERNPSWKTSSKQSETLPTENCTIHTKKEDKTKPEITLKGKDTIEVLIGSKYSDPGATAKDDVDGDLTSKIVIDISKVNMGRTGTYTVTYTVTDQAGNTATKTRKVKVVDKLTEPEKPSNTTNTTNTTGTTNTTSTTNP